MRRHHNHLNGVIAAAPFLPNVMAFGAIVGMASRNAGLTLAELLIASIGVNAATSQLAALDYWRGTIPLITVVLATFALNAKHLLHSASLWPHLRQAPASKLFLAGVVITDSSWVCCQLASQRDQLDINFALTNAWTLAIGWAAGCSLGFFLGSFMGPDDLQRWGASALVPLSMAVIMPLSLRGRSSFLTPVFASAGVAALIFYLTGNAALAILPGTLVGAFLATRSR